ncbi:hypothetical protein Y1Q_0022513 [Alligator mississippiensis]|uniref:Uncharacterized protein n=1 Tax=Alligator mississippiensis TaxID=8496 RepID=A0A151NYG9_ALLMI|nr:hypothetical protein Y1Q_0022513 [Alligator mississippiensis]
MQLVGTLQEPGASWPAQLRTRGVDGPVEQWGERETLGPGDKLPRVPEEEPLPHQESVQRGQGRPPKQEESLEVREVFEDVAMYFSRKEWELLDDDDKVLYRDQMLKNYQAPVSLGKALVF